MKTNVFKKAHEIARKIIRKGDSYRETFRLALVFVYSELKKGVNKMVELKGTEKQVKYANDIKSKLVKTINNAMQELEKFQTENIEINGKRSKKRDRLISEMKNELDIIINIENSKEIIESYKNIFNLDINIFLNNSISKIKEAGASAWKL